VEKDGAHTSLTFLVIEAEERRCCAFSFAQLRN